MRHRAQGALRLVPYVDDSCSDCGVAVVSSEVWDLMTDDQKNESLVFRKIAGRCSSCYHKKYRTEGPARVTRRLDVVIEEAEALFDMGVTANEIAQTLGIKYNSLVRTYSRGRKQGLTTRKLVERWERAA